MDSQLRLRRQAFWLGSSLLLFLLWATGNARAQTPLTYAIAPQFNGATDTPAESPLVASESVNKSLQVPSYDVPPLVKDEAMDEASGDEEEDEEVEDEEESEEPEEEDEEAEETFLPPRLHQVGPVTVECRYGGEFFNKARGGLTNRSATRYRGCLDMMFTLDTEQSGWWPNGKFWAYGFSTHGRTLTEQFVGDSQWYSSNDTGSEPDFTELGEYWYQHSFFDKKLSVTMGRQDPSWNFGFSDIAADFINSSFITMGNIPMPTWPYQTLGVSSLYQANERWKLSGGVYDQGNDRGIWTVTNTNRGMFTIGQLDFQPFSADAGELLTILRMGGWYTSSDPEAVDASSVFESNYGFYGTIDRMLWAERNDPTQGLGTFFMASWAPEDRNQVDWNYGAGFVYRGFFRNRDRDTMGIGLTSFKFSSILRNTTGATTEDALELFYKAQLRRGITVQPDLQYIARPSGLEQDALVAGMRMEINF